MRYLLMSLADLDDEILERLPTDIRVAIKNGTLKVLPKDIVDSLPNQVSDSLPDLECMLLPSQQSKH